MVCACARPDSRQGTSLARVVSARPTARACTRAPPQDSGQRSALPRRHYRYSTLYYLWLRKDYQSRFLENGSDNDHFRGQNRDLHQKLGLVGHWWVAESVPLHSCYIVSVSKSPNFFLESFGPLRRGQPSVASDEARAAAAAASGLSSRSCGPVEAVVDGDTSPRGKLVWSDGKGCWRRMTP